MVKWERVAAIAFMFLACGYIAPAAEAAQAPSAPIPATIDFNRDIRPIFSDNCYACHGPDKNKRKADLRLDTHDGIFSRIKDHQTVAPKDVAKSELYRRITASDPDERMPDPKSNKRLSDREIALIKKWIEQGAPWAGHWAYARIERPAAPNVQQAGFVRNPIDQFILLRLKQAGLTPAPEADRATLIRRVTFDLTGLPPTPREVDAFVKDRSPDAYERLVDRLLASPHFGERMAVFWLDLVRYADTIGYHSDNPMNVWPYRDYVIKSFNEDKPFDQFTIEQLAGDLLPHPTTEQKVASAYNRLLQTTEEGGAQAREYEVKYLTDRVRNISTVWLGSTMGCCQCHDHKFDPFTQKDFYSMGAFFADVKEASIGRREDGMPVPTSQQEQEIEHLDRQISDARQKLSGPDAALAGEQRAWEERAKHATVDWQALHPASATAARGTKLEKQADDSYLATGKFPPKETYTFEVRPGLKGITGLRIEALPDGKFPAHGPGVSPNGNFVLTRVVVTEENADRARPDAGKTGAPVADARKAPNKAVAHKPIEWSRASADFSQNGFPVASLVAGKGPGWAVMPKFGEPHVAILQPKHPLNADGSATLTIKLEFRSQYPQHQIGRLRLSVTSSPDPAGAQSIPPNLRDVLAIASEKRTADQQKELAEYFRGIAPSLAPVREQIAKLEKQKKDLLGSVAKCLVTTAAAPREVRLLHRGNWMDTTGQIMTPQVPVFLAPASLKEQATHRRLTRLDLADWIVSRDNPLTSRVLVNRLWRLYFGTGISKILDDVGSQGEWPTHPELIDWMAMELMDPTIPDSGKLPPKWDLKHMVRLLVTSGTYRQSSKPSPLDLEKDPYNRLLAHQARWRIDAEFVRDNALSISGLLVDHLGGPSVKPYQPAGYWDQLNFPTRTYVADKGPNQYRRGLYTWWQRSFLHPSLAAFDAPSHEEATCERNRSNIPQQALVLLNDPTYVEASRALAARILRDGGHTTADRITFAYELALSRKPRPDELKVLTELYDKHLKEYADDKAAAQKLLKIGDTPTPKDLDETNLAAWTSVARVILNLHETITRM